MKIVPTALVGDASGKSGATVFSIGNQNRVKRVAKQPRTSFQQAIKASFSTATKTWSTLTDLQRAAWTNLGANLKRSDRVGKKHVVKGKQLFNSVNGNLANAGQAQITSAPNDQNVTAPTAASFNTNTNAVQTLTFASTPVPANTVYIYKATKPLSTGFTTAPKGAYKQVAVIPAATATGYNSFAAYSARLGTPVTGKKIFGQIFAVNTVNGAKSLAVSFVGTTA